jgi:hypothetical protein
MQLRQHVIGAVWNKASSCESCLYIILMQHYLPSLPIQWQEFAFIDVVDTVAHKLFNAASVGPLQC